MQKPKTHDNMGTQREKLTLYIKIMKVRYKTCEKFKTTNINFRYFNNNRNKFSGICQDCTTPNYKVLNTQDCNIGNCAVNPGQSLQDICAKYGIDSKCLTPAGCLGGKSSSN